MRLKKGFLWNKQIKDGLLVLLYLAILSGSLRLIFGVLKRVPESKLWLFLVEASSIPNWVVLLAILVLIILILKPAYTLVKRIFVRNTELDNKTDVRSVTIDKQPINLAHNTFATKVFYQHKNPHSFNPLFLEKPIGTIYVWALSTDLMKIKKDKQQNIYLISYATNRGISVLGPNGRYYPNAWAIYYQYPTKTNPHGYWRFWTNGNDLPQITIEKAKPLTAGWHLFVVSWSRIDNFVKFSIDDEVVGETKFDAWPEDFSGSVFLGRWVDDKPFHYYKELIGPSGFFHSANPMKELLVVRNNRPQI